MSESSLRWRARTRLADGGPAQPDGRSAPDELREALAELQVHQVELEVQNEELERAHRRLEESHAAVELSEQRYRELFDRAPVGYLRLDREGRSIEANQTAAGLLAVEQSRLAGCRLSDFVAASHQDAYYLHRVAAARGEEPAPVRVTLCTLDGERRDVELRARPIAWNPGELHVVLLDVTARERAEAGHHESERQRRLMADALPVAVSYVNADGRYEFCNQAFERLHGSPASAVEGRFIFQVLDPDAYAALREHVRAALSGESVRFEGELSFPRTGPRFVSALLAPDRKPDGRVGGFYALMDDRTELEEARRGLRQAAAQIALTEERERRALAADLHDDVGQLLSLASMKLRELEQEAGAAPGGALGEVGELVRRARERITSLSFELSPPLLYDVGFEAATEWLAESLERHYGLRTRVEKCSALPELAETARVALFRAVRELLINVAKHAGTLEARVVLEGRAEGASVLVEDRGVGFDPQARATGFGLYNLVDRIQSLGGRVEIDAEPARGARIALLVPAGGGAP